MNEADLIAKLNNARKLEPKKPVLAALRRKIQSRIDQEKLLPVADANQRPVDFLQAFRALLRPNAMAWALASILIVVGSLSFFLAEPINDITRHTIVQVRLAFTSNEYDKARLAVEHANLELRQLKANDNPETMKNATMLAFTSLQELNLVGEEGKYTTAQCEELYQVFDQYLKDFHKIVQTAKSQNDPSQQELLDSLIRQIEEYEKVVDAKIKMY